VHFLFLDLHDCIPDRLSLRLVKYSSLRPVFAKGDRSVRQVLRLPVPHETTTPTDEKPKPPIGGFALNKPQHYAGVRPHQPLPFGHARRPGLVFCFRPEWGGK